MSNRRLAPDDVQPKAFAFSPENLAWAEKRIACYPEGKQASAVIPLLMRAQEQHANWLPKAAIEYVATMLGMPYIRVFEVATFYTQFQLSPVGTRAHVQVCGTTPCMVRGAGDLISLCKSRIHEHPFHPNADGTLSWEEVECAGACVNAPMVQVFSDTYEDLDTASFTALLDAFERGETPPTGPRKDRVLSAPEGGPVTLLDPALYDGSAIGSWKAAFDERIAAAKAAAEAKAAEAAASAAAPAPAPAPAPAAAPAPAPAKAAEPEEDKVSDDHKPDLLVSAREGKADDLQKINGIGPKLEAMLHGMGVFHFDQIVSWTEMNLKWVDQNLTGFKGRALRDKWIEQAKELLAKLKG